MKVLLALILFPCLSYAGPYYEVVNSTTAGTSTMTISGYIGVAASSTTPTTYKFRIDGPGGYIQFPDGTTQTTASGSGAVLTATQTFTGQNTFTNKVTFSSTVVLGAWTTTGLADSNSWTDESSGSTNYVKIGNIVCIKFNMTRAVATNTGIMKTGFPPPKKDSYFASYGWVSSPIACFGTLTSLGELSIECAASASTNYNRGVGCYEAASW